MEEEEEGEVEETEESSEKPKNAAAHVRKDVIQSSLRHSLLDRLTHRWTAAEDEEK